MSYTEDSLVEQPAIQLFAELGWETLSVSVGDGREWHNQARADMVMADVCFEVLRYSPIG